MQKYLIGLLIMGTFLNLIALSLERIQPTFTMNVR